MRGLSDLDQDACNRMRCQPVHQSHYLAEYKPSISSVCGGTLRAQTEQVFFLANKKGNRAPTVTSGGLRSWFLGLGRYLSSLAAPPQAKVRSPALRVEELRRTSTRTLWFGWKCNAYIHCAVSASMVMILSLAEPGFFPTMAERGKRLTGCSRRCIRPGRGSRPGCWPRCRASWKKSSTFFRGSSPSIESNLRGGF